MSEKFKQALKSTVDKLASGVAVSNGLSHIDIDDLSKLRLLTDNSATTIVSHFLPITSISGSLHKGSFSIGAKMSSDPGNYTLLGLLDVISAELPINRQFLVNNWSGAVKSVVLGSFVVRSITQQSNDAFGDSNVRFVQFEIEAFEFV